MSLLHSLFIDPLRFDVSIALRTNSYPTSFTYVVASDRGANGDVYSAVPGTPGGSFSAKWQARHLVIENNLIELGLNIHPNVFGPPTGVFMTGGDFAPVYSFPQAVVRGNVIRSADGIVDPTNQQHGVWLGSCGNAIVEDNIIDLNPYFPILFDKTSSVVECFNNSTPSGAVIRGLNTNTNRYTDELATNIEDTVCISI